MVTNSLLQIINNGGPGFMIALVLLSIISLAVILERIFMFGKQAVLPLPVVEKLKMNAKNNNSGEIINILRNESSLTAVILRESFDIYNDSNNTVSLKQAVVDSADKHIEGLTNRLWVLRAVGHIAPLLGLMGTVVGLALAFHKIADVGLSQQSVAGGISMALITTITGLGIALPTLFAEYCLRAWAQHQYRTIKNVLHDFVTWFGEK